MKKIFYLITAGLIFAASSKLAHSRVELLIYTLIFFLLFYGIPYGSYKLAKTLIKIIRKRREVGYHLKWSAPFYLWTVLAVFILSLLISFYWFLYRPSKIKHDCSWVKIYYPAEPAVKGRAEDSINLQRCIDEDNRKSLEKTGFRDIFADSSCQELYGFQATAEAKPTRDELRQANKDEYEFCLKDKGL